MNFFFVSLLFGPPSWSLITFLFKHKDAWTLSYHHLKSFFTFRGWIKQVHTSPSLHCFKCPSRQVSHIYFPQKCTYGDMYIHLPRHTYSLHLLHTHTNKKFPGSTQHGSAKECACLRISANDWSLSFHKLPPLSLYLSLYLPFLPLCNIKPLVEKREAVTAETRRLGAMLTLLVSAWLHFSSRWMIDRFFFSTPGPLFCKIIVKNNTVTNVERLVYALRDLFWREPGWCSHMLGLFFCFFSNTDRFEIPVRAVTSLALSEFRNVQSPMIWKQLFEGWQNLVSISKKST